MPDDKTIEIINKTIRERPPRRWLFWSLIILVVLFVIAMVPVGGDIWRKQRIIEARRDYADAIQPIRARFAHIQDWPAWYRARLEGTEGCAEFYAWVERWGGLDGPGGETYRNLEYAVEERIAQRPTLEYGEPTEAALRKALADTQLVHDQAQDLLRFENLVGVPPIRNGVPSYQILNTIFALGVLYRRASFLHYLGDRDAIVAELQLLVRLHLRMNRPDSLSTFAATNAILNYAGRISEWLLPTGTLPPDLHEELRRVGNKDSDFWRRIVHGELAWLAQVYDQFDEVEFVRDPEGLGWFEWVDTSKKPRRNFEEFQNAGLETSAMAAYCRALAMWAEAPVLTPDTMPPNEMLVGSWQGTIEADSRYQLWLQRVLAAAEVRRIESEGVLLSTVVPSPGTFPDVAIEWRDGFMWVQYRPGEKRRLLSSATNEEFDNDVPPLILRPMR